MKRNLGKWIAVLGITSILAGCVDRRFAVDDAKHTEEQESPDIEELDDQVEEKQSNRDQSEEPSDEAQPNQGQAEEPSEEERSDEEQSDEVRQKEPKSSEEIPEAKTIAEIFKQADLKADYEEEHDVASVISTPADINLASADGTNYTFNYNNETFTAVYTPDNWHIVDSFRVENTSDMEVICQALISVHPVHGADMASFRTPEDMVDEWVAHNLAYEMIVSLGSEAELATNSYYISAKDVDFDPYDQGKSILEMYEERTGIHFSGDGD